MTREELLKAIYEAPDLKIQATVEDGGLRIDFGDALWYAYQLGSGKPDPKATLAACRALADTGAVAITERYEGRSHYGDFIRWGFAVVDAEAASAALGFRVHKGREFVFMEEV